MRIEKSPENKMNAARLLGRSILRLFGPNRCIRRAKYQGANISGRNGECKANFTVLSTQIKDALRWLSAAGEQFVALFKRNRTSFRRKNRYNR